MGGAPSMLYSVATTWPTHTNWAFSLGSEAESSRVPRGGRRWHDYIPRFSSATRPRRTGSSPSHPMARSNGSSPFQVRSSSVGCPRRNHLLHRRRLRALRGGPFGQPAMTANVDQYDGESLMFGRGIAIGPDGTIYAITVAGQWSLVAVRPDGSPKWTFPRADRRRVPEDSAVDRRRRDGVLWLARRRAVCGPRRWHAQVVDPGRIDADDSARHRWRRDDLRGRRNDVLRDQRSA